MSNPNKRKAPSSTAPPSGNPNGPKKTRAITSFFSPSASASTPSTSTDPAISVSFDKDAWMRSLTAEQRDLLKLEYDTMHVTWLAELRDVLVTPGFLELKRFLRRERDAGKRVFPEEGDIYSWSRLCPLPKVKIVILGQDPYHGPNQAHGLSFSVRPPTPAPPSLINIFKALARDYPSTFRSPPNRLGLLTPWASQGVLLLNASLTVQAANANSHSGKGWEKLTGKAIEVVARRRSRGVVFMAWGKSAGERCRGVDRKRHLVLTAVHPSPLSAHRGFFDCGHFRKANEWLEERYGVDGGVDWDLGEKVEKMVGEKVEKMVGKKEVGGGKELNKKENGKEKVTTAAAAAAATATTTTAKVVEIGEGSVGKKDEGDETDYDSEGLD